MEGHGSKILMAADLYRRAFARAAKILGGRQQLAEYLRIDSQLLSKWSMPAAQPPEYVLQCVARLLRRELLRNYKGVSKSGSSRTALSPRRKKPAAR
jgi:hypothetical protein